MKRAFALFLALSLVFAVSACGEAPSEPEPEAVTSTPEPTPEPTPTPTPEPEALAIGTEAALGDWAITVTAFEWKDEIVDSYFSFAPGEGNKFAVVSVDISNNGKTADTFLPSYGFGDDVFARIIYGDGYEFSATSLLGYDADIHDEYVNPLSSASGVIAFEIPSSVVDDTAGALYIVFTAGEATAEYQLR